MRGRKPLPTHIKLVTGNRGHRPLNENEPVAPKGAPQRPDNIVGYAAETWDRLVAELDSLGVLATTDSMAMELLAEAYSDHRAATEAIKAAAQAARLENLMPTSGGVQWTSDGRYYKSIGATGAVMMRSNPALADKSDADRRIKAWASEFGLTPSSRSRIASSPKEADPVTAKYFG